MDKQSYAFRQILIASDLVKQASASLNVYISCDRTVDTDDLVL